MLVNGHNQGHMINKMCLWNTDAPENNNNNLLVNMYGTSNWHTLIKLESSLMNKRALLLIREL